MVLAVDDDDDGGGRQPLWILTAVDDNNDEGGVGWRWQWMTSGVVDDDSS
jgi:hypothetical protein